MTRQGSDVASTKWSADAAYLVTVLLLPAAPAMIYVPGPAAR